jgi:predicted transcriptional regulator
MSSTTEATTMGERATITIHTSPETRERLERLASSTRRTKSFLGNEAIEKYLLAEEAFVAGVEEGIVDADAGRLINSDTLKASLRTVIDRSASK